MSTCDISIVIDVSEQDGVGHFRKSCRPRGCHSPAATTATTADIIGQAVVTTAAANAAATAAASTTCMKKKRARFMDVTKLSGSLSHA